jgi:hypothetical protein
MKGGLFPLTLITLWQCVRATKGDRLCELSPHSEHAPTFDRQSYVPLTARLADELETELAGWRAASRLPEAER